MKRYAYLLPLTLPAMVLAGYWLGGAWNFLTAGFSYTLLPLLDLASGIDRTRPDAAETAALERDPSYRVFLYLAAFSHLGLLLFGAWAVTHAAMPWYALLGFVLSVGTVSGSLGILVAHELGHRVNAVDKRMAQVLLVSVCYLHFMLEHNRGHHSHAATRADPASARYGESLYAFLPRTLLGSFAHAWRLERQRLAQAGQGAWQWRNPMLWCVLLPAGVVLGFGLALGTAAVLFFLAQAAIAILLLEMVNYIEHYGLERRTLPGGGHERMTAAHSWNASQRLSTYFLFNLPRHSHHHIQAQRHYQALAHEAGSPQMPAGYAGMLMLTLVPPLWRRVMHPRLAAYR